VFSWVQRRMEHTEAYSCSWEEGPRVHQIRGDKDAHTPSGCVCEGHCVRRYGAGARRAPRDCYVEHALPQLFFDGEELKLERTCVVWRARAALRVPQIIGGLPPHVGRRRVHLGEYARERAKVVSGGMPGAAHAQGRCRQSALSAECQLLSYACTER
jgi:hypothetical protein